MHTKINLLLFRTISVFARLQVFLEINVVFLDVLVSWIFLVLVL